jgi:hypothetical protein
MRLTIAVPVADISDANHLAMVLASGPADALTYGAARWQDAAGNLYAGASTAIGAEFLGRATTALTRPDWDTTNLVNMAGAARAQAKVLLVQEGADPLAYPTQITATFGDDGLAAIAAMGLTSVDGA